MKKISFLLLALSLLSFSLQEETAASSQETTTKGETSTAPTVDSDGVTILTDANINAFLAENKYVMLEFYARNSH